MPSSCIWKGNYHERENTQARQLGARSGTTGGIGGNVFGWTADEPTSFRLLDAFVAAGFNLIDTADVYLAVLGTRQPGR